MSDEIEKSLRAMKGEELTPRIVSTIEEKKALIKAIGGPKTALSIRKALKTYPKSRIPFLFSSLDPQLVVDIMANDLDEVLRS